jgi:hypothetical protein
MLAEHVKLVRCFDRDHGAGLKTLGIAFKTLQYSCPYGTFRTFVYITNDPSACRVLLAQVLGLSSPGEITIHDPPESTSSPIRSRNRQPGAVLLPAYQDLLRLLVLQANLAQQGGARAGLDDTEDALPHLTRLLAGIDGFPDARLAVVVGDRAGLLMVSA